MRYDLSVTQIAWISFQVSDSAACPETSVKALWITLAWVSLGRFCTVHHPVERSLTRSIAFLENTKPMCLADLELTQQTIKIRLFYGGHFNHSSAGF